MIKFNGRFDSCLSDTCTRRIHLGGNRTREPSFPKYTFRLRCFTQLQILKFRVFSTFIFLSFYSLCIWSQYADGFHTVCFLRANRQFFDPTKISITFSAIWKFKVFRLMIHIENGKPAKTCQQSIVGSSVFRTGINKL